MPTAQLDFHYDLERITILAVDVAVAARAADMGRLPAGHHRQLRSIIRDFETAQTKLHSLKEYPWRQSRPSASPQLELPL